MVRATDAPIRVEVTQADIDAGVRGDGIKCPIALAVSRGLGCMAQVALVHILSGTSKWTVDDFILGWMAAFDEKRPCQPFTIELTIDGQARRVG